MNLARAVSFVFLVSTVALAGCTGGGSSDPIHVTGPTDSGAYTFSAGVSAATYTWDFGDGRPTETGKEVTHDFGVSNGNFTVKLTAIQEDGTSATYRQVVVVGSGVNAEPSFHLVAEREWSKTGEPITLQVQMDDPDGDPGLYRWFCRFLGEPQPLGQTHTHPGGGGTPFGSGGAVASITTSYLNGTLPAGERTVEGDLCDNIGADGAFSETSSLTGSLGTFGVYEITLLAKDPAHPSVFGTLDLVASPDRPDAAFRQTFEGTLTAGSGGTLQGLADQAQQGMVLDAEAHSFNLELPPRSVWFNLTFDENGINDVTFSILKGGKTIVADQSGSVRLDQGQIGSGTHTLAVTLDAGVDVSYTITMEGTYDLDPRNKWEDWRK